jgi:hypothetical protein
MPYQSLASNETREARDETGCCCAQCFYLLSLRRYITSCPTMFPALRAPFGRSFGPYRIADIPITTKVSPQLIILEIEILYSRKVDENTMTEIRAGKQKNVLKPNYCFHPPGEPVLSKPGRARPGRPGASRGSTAPLLPCTWLWPALAVEGWLAQPPAAPLRALDINLPRS